MRFVVLLENSSWPCYLFAKLGIIINMQSKKLQSILRDPFIIALIVLLVAGIFLRFYNFRGFVTYLGDQGRDSIVIKRIVTLEDFPGIGASSSVGDVFLGPFYYYFAAPWLLLTNFDPVGPAVGVGVFSSIFILAMYFVTKDLFNKRVAIIASALVTFSYALIWLSRFSWNPNLLPFSALLTTYFFIKALQNRSFKHFFLAGTFLSISTQFHYVSLAFGLPMFILIFGYVFQYRKEVRRILRELGGLPLGFAVFQAPLIIFDVKNNFLNTRGLLGILGKSNSSGRSFVDEMVLSMQKLHEYSFQFEIPTVVAGGILVLVIASLYLLRKKESNIRILSFFFLSLFVVTALFTDKKNLHYFGTLYPLYYMLIAYVLGTYVWKKGKAGILVLLVLLGIFVGIQHSEYNFLYVPGARLISRAEKISQHIYSNIDGETIQITSLPDHYGDYMYRYYLEVWGNRPVERASLIKADELFVVCQDPCKPIGDPQWDIAYFEPTKIVGTWEVEDVTIYKLTRD